LLLLLLLLKTYDILAERWAPSVYGGSRVNIRNIGVLLVRMGQRKMSDTFIS
jgi:hypothetical protein